MSQKLVFLDIDGTVIDTNEVIHSSTAEALKLAQKNGHKLFLCTGREKHIVTPKLFELGLSNGVFSAGASVICDGKEIYHSSFSPTVYDKMMEVLVKHNALIVLEGLNEEILLNDTYKENYSHFKKWLKQLGSVFVDGIPAGLDNIDKVVFFASDCTVQQLSEEMGKECNIVTMSYQSGDNGGEIMQTGITKATGIQKVLEYYGADQKDTIGIGDGANDIEMLRFCSTGIAMGNSDVRAKNAADIITDDIADDGLYKAFKRMELI